MSRKIDLTTFSLERVSIDYGIECVLQSTDRWINLRFRSAQLSDGDLIEVDQPNSLVHLLRFLHIAFTQLWVNDANVLSLTFGSGEELRVYPAEDFESWELVTSENLRWVCMPGGEIAEWN